MAEVQRKSVEYTSVQCQHFVVRKKRLCRMTVRPGRQYCGEHEPDPKTTDGQDDTRIPCPNDPKHTCYISKLEKHLLVCNARPVAPPPYIVHNINAPAAVQACPRKPLSEISKDTLMQVIDKVNLLYDKHVKENISTASEKPIHAVVVDEFSEGDRTESSRRHLRQASRLLWLLEDEGLVRDRTCYVELGAGKGQLSYYACAAWCGAGGDACGSGALAVDRAALRHKRDNKSVLARRLRADLAHLALQHAPAAARAAAIVGLAKHLCGAATDYALRCLTAGGVVHKTRGAVLATCCHHRCDRAAYVANKHLQELGVSGEEFNVLLGVVSWATCGDGRSRHQRDRDRDHAPADQHTPTETDHSTTEQIKNTGNITLDLENSEHSRNINTNKDATESISPSVSAQEPAAKEYTALSQECREEVGRRAKALLDWGRVLYLRELGFDARLCYYVPTTVSLENVCIIARKECHFEPYDLVD